MAGTSRVTTNLLRAGAIGLAALGGVGLTLAAGVASAGPAPAPRKITGNVTTCAEAKLDGAILFGTSKSNAAAGSGTITSDGTTLSVTIKAGYTASGIVVKGGPDTNVYDGPVVGRSTVDGMVSPRNRGGNIPQISHWLVCGGRSATAAPSTSATTNPPTPTSSPSASGSPTTAPPTAPPTGATTPPAGVVAAAAVPSAGPQPGRLPTTGVRAGLAIGSAVILIGAGALMVVLVRRRRRFEA